MTEDQKPQPGEPLPEYSIMWIDKELSVPGDRRQVLVFGNRFPAFGPRKPFRGFLGTSRYNMDRGSGRFDIEKDRHFLSDWDVVTHWAEITDPEGRRL